MSVNVADKIQILKGPYGSVSKTHILKIENDNHETLWEYTEPTITGNDVLFAIDNTTGTGSWEKQPEIYHCTNDSTNKIFFYKYSNFDHTASPYVGYTFFYGDRAWTDGTDTYIGNYKYNTSTNTWTYIDWQISGYSLHIVGDYVWSDGTDVYYLAPSNVSHITSSPSFKFDKSTNTWISWGSAAPDGWVAADGRKVWTDGTNVYYSDGTKQYQWDKTNKQWSEKTWMYADEWAVVTSNFYGDKLITIDNTVYARWYRSGQGIKIYFLNENGSWAETGNDTTSFVNTLLFIGTPDIFTDGSNIYASDWVSHDPTYYLYKITADIDHILSVTATTAKSIPRQVSGLLGRRFFSLGLNAKKPDSHARLYSTTIF